MPTSPPRSRWRRRPNTCDDTRGPRASGAATALHRLQDADRPPVTLDAAMLFAPVRDLVRLPALEAAGLDRGGILAIAEIHLTVFRT